MMRWIDLGNLSGIRVIIQALTNQRWGVSKQPIKLPVGIASSFIWMPDSPNCFRSTTLMYLRGRRQWPKSQSSCNTHSSSTLVPGSASAVMGIYWVNSEWNSVGFSMSLSLPLSFPLFLLPFFQPLHFLIFSYSFKSFYSYKVKIFMYFSM